jgi:hypothetical protein
MKEITKLQAAKILYYAVSGFRQGIGEDPYPPFEDSNRIYQDEFMIGLVNGFLSENLQTDEDVHEFWMDWARQHKSDHASIKPFKDLSETEKIKDQIIIDTMFNLTQYFKIV